MTEKATLRDVIEMTLPPEPQPLLEEMLEELRTRDAFMKIIPLVGTPAGQPGAFNVKGKEFLSALNAIDEKIDKLRRDIFLRDGVLPLEARRTLRIEDHGVSAQVYLEKTDSFALASEVPTATLAHLRGVADAMGFVIVPWAFLHDDYLKLKGAERAKAFNDTMSPGFTSFVVAPLSAYDLVQRIKAKDDLPVYFGASDLAMTALEMATPTMRFMWSAISDLDKKTKVLEETVSQHAIRIDMIEKKAAEERAANARRELEARAFQTRDPLIFAVPAGTDVRTADCRAVIGPCWGDKMEVAVFEACGLRVRK